MEPIAKFQILPWTGESARLTAVGDLRLSPVHPGVASPSDFMDDSFVPIFRESDLALVNFECPLDTGGAPIPKSGLNLAASRQTVEFLSACGFDVAVLANNHIMDYGPDGLRETETALHDAGIKTVGAGRNQEDACRPAVFRLQDAKVALLAVAEGEFSSASGSTPGAATMDPATISNSIRKAKSENDLVVVSAHGGTEMYPFPSPGVQRRYRWFVDCGADAVLGHHPHVSQGVEIYRERPIVYSLGNFLFEMECKVPDCWHRGLIATLHIAERKVCGIELFATRQRAAGSRRRITPFDAESLEEYSRRFARLSEICCSSGQLEEFWRCYCESRKSRFAGIQRVLSSGLPGKFLPSLKFAGSGGKLYYVPVLVAEMLANMFRSDSRRREENRMLWNLITCPAHHELMATILESEWTDRSFDASVMNELTQFMADCR